MPLVRTYVDSGVLIWAVASKPPHRFWARNTLNDQRRRYLFSDFVRLETVPKMEFAGHVQQAADVRATLERMQRARVALPKMLATAFHIATRDGLGAMDAMHVAAAMHANCAEIITTEKPGASLHRAKDLRVVYIGE